MAENESTFEQLPEAEKVNLINNSYAEKYGFHDSDDNYFFKSRKGLDEGVVAEISLMKKEPEWMTTRRLEALEIFRKKPMPQWGGGGALNDIDFDDIFYYMNASGNEAKSWDDVPDEIKRTFDRLGIPEAEQKFLSGVGAQYECLRGDARVYTGRGLVPIEAVEAGDVVFSFDEVQEQIIPATVKATAYKGEREVFEVAVGTRTIHATANHPFLALAYRKEDGKQRGRYTREWKYLEELQVGDLVALAKQLPDVGQAHTLLQPEIKTEVVGRNQSVEYKLDISNRYNEVSLPEQTSAELMWWFGLYIGDGFIHHTNGADKARVEFAIPATDAGLRTELEQVTEAQFSLPMTNGDPYRVTANSTIIARFLEANGFEGTAHTKRVPQWVFTLPEEQRLAFIGGYVDADGYVRDHEKNRDISLTSANPDLLQDVKNLAASCGIPTSNIHRFESKHPHDKTRTVTGYRFTFSGDFDRIACRSPQRTGRLGKRQYHHDYSSAKGTTFRDHTNEFIGFAKITSITPAGVAPVYDIEVDGPHNFVAEGLIVHNSEVVYHNIKKELEDKGVIFLSTDHALQQHPELFKQYFGTIIPSSDNKFAALNTAVWSGGSFIYVPKGVKIDMPLQAYFRINAQSMGQFERTLIIADEGSWVHYVEGCTAPNWTEDSLHSAVVEIIVKKGARVRYTTIQNWSNNVYNLVTKRAICEEGATMEWVDGNIGCLAEGSTVTTPDGIKPIESLEVGDEVLSYDDQVGELVFRRVLAKKFSGNQPVHNVVAGERELRVTANHPFYSYVKDEGGYRLAYVRADHLQEAIVPTALPETVLTHEPTLAVAGSGHIVQNRNVGRSQIELSESVEIVNVNVSEASAELVPTWDIEVEGTGNFVSQGFIVHNSKLTMKYPAVYMMGPHSHGEILSIAFAGKGQHQDAGAKVIHAAPHTSSIITSKSISKDGGRAGYRGLVQVLEGAYDSKSSVVCDALILDDESRSDTYPYIDIREDDVSIGHEATVSKVGEEQLFYLMSRGVNEEEALSMIVSGFIEPIVKELPMEYAVEMNRLIQLEMEGSVG
ncbi:MAG: SufD family Fe-S cluster assembly protein [Ardenticatenales bacterium]|nr:SufD family Fe-S cluster assembly protein [Ardenticatenales bacterium]